MKNVHRRINAILSSSDLSRTKPRRRAIRMDQLDRMLGLSRNAMAALPLLLLPMAIGALILVVMPGNPSGAAAIVFSTHAVSVLPSNG